MNIEDKPLAHTAWRELHGKSWTVKAAEHNGCTLLTAEDERGAFRSHLMRPQEGRNPTAKAVASVLAVLLLAGLTACGGGDPEDDRVTLDKPDCTAGACK